MRNRDHRARSKRFFGDEFKEVHDWLDELFGVFGARHRCKRHHWEGIREVRKRWGPKAMQAAVQHIVDDLQQMEDPMANESWIPKNEEDYKRKGYI